MGWRALRAVAARRSRQVPGTVRARRPGLAAAALGHGDGPGGGRDRAAARHSRRASGPGSPAPARGPAAEGRSRCGAATARRRSCLRRTSGSPPRPWRPAEKRDEPSCCVALSPGALVREQRPHGEEHHRGKRASRPALGGPRLPARGGEGSASLQPHAPGPVAQRSEQRTHNPSVDGSNPSRPTPIAAAPGRPGRGKRPLRAELGSQRRDVVAQRAHLVPQQRNLAGKVVLPGLRSGPRVVGALDLLDGPSTPPPRARRPPAGARTEPPSARACARATARARVR